MPIEIKELIIRASVQEQGEGASRGVESSRQASSDKNKTKEERLVSRCVEQVMEILRIQNER